MQVGMAWCYWDNKLEEKEGRYYAIRLGFRQVKGLKENEMRDFVTNRAVSYNSMNELRTVLSDAILERLADADAFGSLNMDRRNAYWQVTAKDHPVGIYHGQSTEEEKVSLPTMHTSEQVVHDYSAMALSLKAHPVSFLREKLDQLHITPTSCLQNIKPDTQVKVAGLVLVRQRPGTAKGVCFMTIEDETGFANVVIFQDRFEKFRKEILQSRLIMVEGKLQIEGDVIHVIVSSCHNMNRMLKQLTPKGDDDLPLLTLSRADEKQPIPDARNFK
jgi:error-prone DNA polymerase